MFNIRKIVVPTDFSKLSLSALDYARDLAEQMNASIHIIYVMDCNPPIIGKTTGNGEEEKRISLLREESQKQLSTIRERFLSDTSVEILEILRKGVDYEEIVNYSHEIKADIIIIATHGRTGALHSLLGSVAEKVIRYSMCPVLVIKPQEE